MATAHTTTETPTAPLTVDDVDALTDAGCWSLLVGSMAPAAFLDIEQSGTPASSVNRYLMALNTKAAAFSTYRAKEAAAAKLVRFIEYSDATENPALNGTELRVLRAAYDAASCNGFDFGFADEVESEALTRRQIAGYFSSLVKKGYLYCYDNEGDAGFELTDAGMLLGATDPATDYGANGAQAEHAAAVEATETPTADREIYRARIGERLVARGIVAGVTDVGEHLVRQTLTPGGWVDVPGITSELLETALLAATATSV